MAKNYIPAHEETGFLKKPGFLGYGTRISWEI